MTPIKPTDPEVLIFYLNHRGELGWRKIRPIALWYGKTAFHPEHQYMLKAWDCDKGIERDFAAADILQWKDPSIEQVSPFLDPATKSISDAVPQAQE